MRVTRLEIFGFKSFVERFTLAFDHNLLGIVGPNGCGKSNIVDSLRWVLGETHAKQLRGSALEDLIFNGSDSRRPLGMAEVSITIKPDKGWKERLENSRDELATILEEAEAEAAPKLAVEDAERVEVADPEINVADTEVVVAHTTSGLNGNGSVNGSGAAKTAADQSFLHSGLLDIPGLFNAAEIQLTRRLYRSGESEYFINRVPCRLRDMLDLYRIIGLGARGLSIVQQGQIGQLISKKPIERRELLEEAAGISGFRTKLESAQRKLEKTSFNMDRLRDITIEVEKQVKVLKRQAQRARTRGELKAALEEAELSLFRARSSRLLLEKIAVSDQRETAEQEVGAAQAKLDEQQAQQLSLQATLEEFDADVYRLRLARDAVSQRLMGERERRQAHERELVRLDTVAANIERQLGEFGERREQNAHDRQIGADELVATQRTLEDLQAGVAAAETELARVKEQTAERLKAIEAQSSAELTGGTEQSPREEIEQLQSRIAGIDGVSSAAKELDREISQTRSGIGQQQRELHKERLRHTALSTERKSLERQVAALAEHVVSTTRNADEALTGGKALVSGLNVAAHLERAVSAVLGERGTFVIAEHPYELANRYLQNGGKGARIGVISTSPRVDDIAGISDFEREAAPSARLLTEAIGVEADVAQPLQALLGSVVLVDSLAEALALQQRAQEHGNFSRTAVTHNGEVVTAWGWYTTQGETASFSFGRRIEELQSEEQTIEGEIARRETDLAQAEQVLEQQLAKASELHAEKDSLAAAQRELSRMLERERSEQKRLQDEIRRREVALRNEALQEERTAERAVSERKSQVQQAQYSIGVAERQLQKLAEEYSKLGARAEQLTAEQANVRDERAQAERKLNDMSDESTQTALQAELEQLDRQIKEVEQKRNSQASVVGNVAQGVSEGRRAFEIARDRQNKVELAVEKLDLELRLMREDVARYHGDAAQIPTVEAAQALAAEYGDGLAAHADDLQDEAHKLRQRLEREGEVDPEAIERYDVENARLEAMQAQYADLDSACKILDKTIRRLKELSRARFLETFNDVSRRFEELIPRLFGGGAGKMELVNPDDPLTSGVEINVRPPGKRPSNMELLSGGEKALVATAVLIAMFLHRPSPICVLDEVDAPLDDANLDRFLNLIKEISSKTQFLIITHNKASMAAADRLVGITMQESGVSTALSVTLREAEEQLERWAVNA